MTSERNSLGRILKQQRVMRELTLDELAAKSGMSASHLGRIERGERFPSATTLREIAGPLGFAENQLFAHAGYLSPQAPTAETLGRLDPYVASVLSQEPVEVQRTVIGTLSILKSLSWGSFRDNPAELPELREYLRRKYPNLSEDIITMIKDLIERQRHDRKETVPNS